MDDRYPYEISSISDLKSVYDFVVEDRTPKHLSSANSLYNVKMFKGLDINKFRLRVNSINNGIATPTRVDRIKTRTYCSPYTNGRFTSAVKLPTEKWLPKMWRVADVGGLRFIQEPAEKFHEISCHQFVRASVLKWYFLRKELSDNYTIRDVFFLNKKKLNRVRTPYKEGEPIFVSYKPFRRSIVGYGEPTVHGFLTGSGIRDLKSEGCEVPKQKYSPRNKLNKYFGLSKCTAGCCKNKKRKNKKRQKK